MTGEVPDTEANSEAESLAFPLVIQTTKETEFESDEQMNEKVDDVSESEYPPGHMGVFLIGTEPKRIEKMSSNSAH
ncbi:hypothetical protein MMC25_001755 [Agyrium rufum]|nr:hypothetical protein [Agyrium rufum]